MGNEPTAGAHHESEQPKLLLEGAFSGRVQFQQLICDGICSAAREGWREMVWMDASFEDWPLGERSVEADLQAWSATGRKLTLVAKRFDGLIARHHRFVNWRRQWSHIIEARAVASASDEEFPSLILSPHWAMHRLQSALCKGVAGFEAKRRVDLRELSAQWLSLSAPAFAATTLGI